LEPVERSCDVRRRAIFLTLALSAVAFSAYGPVASAKTSATTVRVSMTEFRFTLSKKVVPRGAVTFIVVNKGTIGHDFKIAGKKTPVIAAGKSRTLKVVFTKAGKYRYLCTLPSHATAGMKGTLTVR
jgi:uncharacterized cupredoxin-like copper-binding protein